MNTLIINGRVVDPASGTDKKAGIAVADGKIAGIGSVPAGFKADRTIDAAGCIVAPGLVDLAVRLREPGHEHDQGERHDRDPHERLRYEAQDVERRKADHADRHGISRA